MKRAIDRARKIRSSEASHVTTQSDRVVRSREKRGNAQRAFQGGTENVGKFLANYERSRVKRRRERVARMEGRREGNSKYADRGMLCSFQEDCH